MRQCATEYHNSRAMPDFTLDVSVDGADDVVTTSSGAHAHVSDNASSVVQLTRDTLREACELPARYSCVQCLCDRKLSRIVDRGRV